MAILLLLAYWPALHGGFIWDDVTFVIDSDWIHSPGGWRQIWLGQGVTDYWPVTYSLFWVMWRTFGEWTLGYHLVNLCVHGTNALLVWAILRELKFRRAYLAALIFALHPLQVESVAWIFQLKTTLAAFFALLSLYLWIGPWSLRRYLLAALSFVLGLLSKTSVVTWPLVLTLILWWKHRGLRRHDLWLLLPFYLLSLLIGVLGLSWYRYDHLVGGERVRDLAGYEKVAIGAKAFWFYLGQMLWPTHLMFIYPRWSLDGQGIWSNGSLDAAALVAAFLMAMFAALRLGHRGPMTFLLYGLATLLPVLGVVDIYFFRFSYVADHYVYLALPGLVIGLLAWVEKLPVGERTRATVAFVFVLFCSVYSFQRARVFRDEETVWRDSLTKNPTAWMAHFNLGSLLQARGQLDEASDHFRQAIRWKPDYAEAYVGMGAVVLAKGDEELAQNYFLKALDIFPFHAPALNNLAGIALRHGQTEIALQMLRQAVEHRPDYLRGYKSLGDVYMLLDQKQEALLAYSQALSLRPDDAEAQSKISAAKALPERSRGQ